MSYTISAVYANKDGSVYAQDYNGELWVFGTHFNSYESATRMAMKIECAKVINLQYWYKKVDQITQCDCAGCHKGIFVTRRGPVPCNQCRGKGFKNADDRKRTVNYFTYAYHPQGQNTPSHTDNSVHITGRRKQFAPFGRSQRLNIWPLRGQCLSTFDMRNKPFVSASLLTV